MFQSPVCSRCDKLSHRTADISNLRFNKCSATLARYQPHGNRHRLQHCEATDRDGSATTSSSNSSSDNSSSEHKVDSASGGSRNSTSSTKSRRVILPPACDLGGAEPQARWNAVSLAFLGDAVWEAHLRSYFYSHGDNVSSQHYNSRVAAKANTHAQATCFQLLLAEGWPNSEEASLMRWAANSGSVTPPKHATRQQYKQATALEALVAYLYLKDGQRLQELMDWLLDPDRVHKWRSDVTAGQQQPVVPRAPLQGRRRRGQASSS